MRSKARKWGNSLGVLLPKAVTDEMSVSDGTQLQIECDGLQIVIKVIEKKSYRLKDLLKDYPKQASSPEITWGPKRAREEW